MVAVGANDMPFSPQRECAARVRAAFFAEAFRRAGPLVRTPFREAARRSEGDLRAAENRACLASDSSEAALWPS